MRLAGIDVAEFCRFVASGLLAAACNLATVWLVGRWMPSAAALAVGIVVALSLSFVASKLFAFGSRSWERASGEAMRFLIVYGVGCAAYMAFAVIAERFASGEGVRREYADALGVLAGSGVMMVTSYLGHRFFTYRTHLRDPV